MASQVVERVIRAGKLEKGMVLRRWPDVKGPVDRTVEGVGFGYGSYRGMRVWLEGRSRPVHLGEHETVVVAGDAG